jgi:uncharacterized membrane protein YdjX (TVP38/TMEM64 family)
MTAGALGIDLWLYAAGTFLGLVPGITILAFFSDQIFQVLKAPSPSAILILVTCVAAWLAITAAIQSLVSKSYKAK